MRAIRRTVRATQRAMSDPTMAYVDLVAALESVSADTGTPPGQMPWDALDGRKRKLIDKALQGADAGVVERVRAAVLEAELAGARRRFVAFVLDHVDPSYYRFGTDGVVRPVRALNLERMLNLSYQLRSGSVHALQDLPSEAFLLGDRSEVTAVDDGEMLTHEALRRLATHVITRYAQAAPTGIDKDFNWRAALPGLIHVRAAPQYWVWRPDGFTVQSADQYFAGFVHHLLAVIAADGQEPIADMAAVLTKIEQLLRGNLDRRRRAAIVTIYALWDTYVASELRRPNAASTLEAHTDALEQPSIYAHVARLLLGNVPDWSTDQWAAIARERRQERSRRKQLELPRAMDALLWVRLAERYLADGDTDAAVKAAKTAVEEHPGNVELADWEHQLLTDHPATLDERLLLLGVSTKEPSSDDEGS